MTSRQPATHLLGEGGQVGDLAGAGEDVVQREVDGLPQSLLRLLVLVPCCLLRLTPTLAPQRPACSTCEVTTSSTLC